MPDAGHPELGCRRDQRVLNAAPSPARAARSPSCGRSGPQIGSTRANPRRPIVSGHESPFVARRAARCAIPVGASAQALTDITSLYVSYSARKNAARPAGELKARLDSVDREAAVASRLGRTGEVRRLLAMGNVLLSGGEWTDVLDYATSLLIRTTASSPIPGARLRRGSSSSIRRRSRSAVL